MPIIIIIVYCCWAERCLKEPTPGKTQMLSPPRTTCTSCARLTGPLAPAASLCVWAGQHLAPYGWLRVSVWRVHGLFLWLLCYLYPRVALPALSSFPSSYKHGFSYKYESHQWVPKLLTLACSINVVWAIVIWGTQSNRSFKIMGTCDWKIELGSQRILSGLLPLK